jgi:vacuolar protein sorting-associated protein IST1
LIKDQNMLDVYVMMEGYCNLMVERLQLIEQERLLSVSTSLSFHQQFSVFHSVDGIIFLLQSVS